VDQVVQVEIDQVALAANVQVDLVARVVPAEIAQADLADLVQVEIDQVALADLVQPVPVVASQVRVHQVELQVVHQVEDQVDVRIQRVVAETQLVRLVNLAAAHQRVVSQSAQSVKSLTT